MTPAYRVRRGWRRLNGLVSAGILLSSFFACSKNPELPGLPPVATAGSPAVVTGGLGGGFSDVTAGTGASAGQDIVVAPFPGNTPCVPKTCKELGYTCGSVVQCKDKVVNCEDEGLTCGDLEVCVGSGDEPLHCETSFGACDVCNAIPKCAEDSPTRITGRVITPGRSDTDSGNQVGVPNAVVYILRSTKLEDIPAIPTGIPTGGTSCDRCEEQDLGPFLLGTVTDATGRFTLEGAIPVDKEFLLVVKVGRFRRVIKQTVTQACGTNALPTELPGNPTRLPRALDDGLAVNIPAIAVTTGQIDAMECVLEKMGLAHSLFGNPAEFGAGKPRIHLYRGGGGGGLGGGDRAGASIDAQTPNDDELYGSLANLQKYDLLISDCEGMSYDQSGAQRQASGANVREYVNRGGRMFASHLSFTWLDQNGTQEYSEANAVTTGLARAAVWANATDNNTNQAEVLVSMGRDTASPRIDSFADWLAAEGVTMAPEWAFDIQQPRSHALSIGEGSEEFVYSEREIRPNPGPGSGGRGGGSGGRSGGGAGGAGGRAGSGGAEEPAAGGASGGTAPRIEERIQQFSFNTPYGAPPEAACGRVAYSGFHVAASGDGNATSPFGDVTFPEHCTGSLTAQEKVLLYMLFDLGACIGELPPPPKCEPDTCESTGTKCGFIADGCGKVLDCGPCVIPPPN